MFKKISSFFKIKNRKYISDYDKFLKEYDLKNQKKSQSQIQEISKHKNIFNRTPQKKIKW